MTHTDLIAHARDAANGAGRTGGPMNLYSALADALEAQAKALRDALAYIDKGHVEMARNILAAALRHTEGGE